jgi:uncharacterized protein (UPF0335 family)
MAKTPTSGQVGGIAADQLRAIVERVERLHLERKAIGQDIAEIYSEAAANGFDRKVLQRIVKLRAQDPDALSEFETMVEIYMDAINGTNSRRDEQEAA